MERKFAADVVEKNGLALFEVIKNTLEKMGYEIESVGGSPFSLNSAGERLICTLCSVNEKLLDFDPEKVIEKIKKEIASILLLGSEDIEISISNMLDGQISWLGHVVVSLK